MVGNITLYFEDYNGTPGFVLCSGNHVLEIPPNTIAQGLHNFEFSFEDANNIVMYMIGKNNAEDTKLDTDGSIIKDKHVKIIQMQLNYLNFDDNWLYSVDCNPYFGFNEKTQTIQVPALDQWPLWYLSILEKLNR